MPDQLDAQDMGRAGLEPDLSSTGGIVSGPGNQGSACVANLGGHAGTSGTFIGLPRQMAFGQGTKPQ